MRVQVTEQDIQKGVPTNFFSCPIAIALSRATKKSIGIAWGIKDKGKEVTEDSLWYPMICKGGKWRFVNLSIEVLNWINDFDRKKPVTPIEFDVEL